MPFGIFNVEFIGEAQKYNHVKVDIYYTAGTKILFFKAPGGNDKTLFDIDNALKKWLSSWEAAD